MGGLATASFQTSRAEADLLRAVSPLLESRAAIEVGAGNGDLTRWLLEEGYRPIHVVELDPDSALLLRTRFGATDDVTIHDSPAASGNGDPSALFASTNLPPRAGLLRVDVGLRSYPIVCAFGDLTSDLVIARHWRELPDGVGRCPWTLGEMTRELEGRGFSSFVSMRGRGHLTAMEWNRATFDEGESGLLLFIHDRVVDRLMPVLLDTLSRTQEELWDHTRLARAQVARLTEAEASLKADREQIMRRIGAMAEQLPPPLGVQDEDGSSPAAPIAVDDQLDHQLERLERRLRISNPDGRHVLHHSLHRIVDRLPLSRASLVHSESHRAPSPETPRVAVGERLRLAVNLRHYLGGQMGGMDIYVRNVVKGLAAGTKTVRPALTIFTVESQVESLRALAPEADFRVEPDHRSGLTLASEFDSKAHEVLFCPLLILDPMPADIPSAVMVPDLQHEFFPQFLDARMLELRRRTYRVSAARASRVFTLSEFSKRTLVDLYGLEPEKVVITYLDVDEDFRRGLPIAPSPAFSELALPDDYLLYPASFLRHKNHTALLRALKILLGTAHPTLGLVLTGPGPIEARVTDEIAKLELEKRVRLIGFQPRDVHVELYRHARALLFPSRFEGFGLPLLEAFHAQTPVISSRVAACPEIAGDAAVYFDENDPADIAAAVDRVLTDRELEADLIERGRKRAEQFSWEKTIEMTLKSLETLAAGR